MMKSITTGTPARIAKGLIVGVILGISTPASAAEEGLIHDPALIDALQRADIIVLGEVHDNPEAHRLQAEAMDIAFQGRTTRPAVVFEQIPRSLQPVLDSFSGPWTALAEAVHWQKRGWPDPTIYAPVFQTALDAKAQLIAGDLTKAKIRASFGEGAAALPEPVRDVYALMDPLPPKTLEAMTTIQFESHCELMPQNQMGGMVNVQRARDAALAEAVLHAYRAGFRPVVLITGNGHARIDHGAGHLLALAAPEARRVVLGIEEAGSEQDRSALYDKMIEVPPHPRPDPCTDLQKRLAD